MNELIIGLPVQTRAILYHVIGANTVALFIIISTLYGRKFNLTRGKAFLCSIVSFLGVFSLASKIWGKADIYIFESGQTAAFRSVLLIPLACWALSKYVNASMQTLCDYLTPTYFCAHGIATTACLISGCCGGCVWSWGITNPRSGQTVFPVQPIVITYSLFIGIFAFWYIKNKKYNAHGKAYAISLIMYGSFRYAIELVTQNDRIIGILSLFSFYAIAMVLMGLIILYFIEKQTMEEKETASTISYGHFGT